AVGGEPGVKDHNSLRLDGSHVPKGSKIPQVHIRVARSDSQCLAITRETDRIRASSMTRQHGGGLAGRRVPEPASIIGRNRREESSVRGKTGTEHAEVMAAECFGKRSVGNAPNSDVLVILAAGHNLIALARERHRSDPGRVGLPRT